MAILAECPRCHTKQAAKNKACKCGANLDQEKKSKKIKYWISYRLPDGKQRRESVDAIEGANGYSIENAKDALAKRRVQKKENRVFDMLPESNMTFQELADWYLDLPRVKKLTSCIRYKIALNNFNIVFGNWQVGTIKLTDIEEYQEKREDQGMEPATIDLEVRTAKTMVTKAFYADKVDGRILKAFGNIEKVFSSVDHPVDQVVKKDLMV